MYKLLPREVWRQDIASGFNKLHVKWICTTVHYEIVRCCETIRQYVFTPVTPDSVERWFNEHCWVDFRFGSSSHDSDGAESKIHTGSVRSPIVPLITVSTSVSVSPRSHARASVMEVNKQAVTCDHIMDVQQLIDTVVFFCHIPILGSPKLKTVVILLRSFDKTLDHDDLPYHDIRMCLAHTLECRVDSVTFAEELEHPWMMGMPSGYMNLGHHGDERYRTLDVLFHPEMKFHHPLVHTSDLVAHAPNETKIVVRYIDLQHTSSCSSIPSSNSSSRTVSFSAASSSSSSSSSCSSSSSSSTSSASSAAYHTCQLGMIQWDSVHELEQKMRHLILRGMCSVFTEQMNKRILQNPYIHTVHLTTKWNELCTALFGAGVTVKEGNTEMCLLYPVGCIDSEKTKSHWSPSSSSSV